MSERFATLSFSRGAATGRLEIFAFMLGRRRCLRSRVPSTDAATRILASQGYLADEWQRVDLNSVTLFRTTITAK